MASGPNSSSSGWKQAVMSWQKRPRNVVAWESKAEWDQVMVGLYCGDREIQQDALDRISAWKSRYGQRMPLAVECTADLIRCKLLDASGVLKSHELVLTYGLALVRFVNLITERKQKTVIVSLRRLAKELNIPVWIVNLRHDLTHGNLPHLDACQKGCDVVLEWLRQTYWSRQLGNNLVKECEDNEESPPEGTSFISRIMEPEKLESLGCGRNVVFQENVMDVLVSYKKHQFEVLQQMQNISQACKMWCNPSSEIEWIVAQVKELFLENREAVIEVLLDDGFLIPTTEELQVLNIDSQETNDWDFKTPHTFICFWYALLKGLHSKDFTQTLVEMLFRELKKYAWITELRSDYVIRWLTKIIETSTQTKKKPKHSHTNRSKSSPEPFLQHVPLQWQKILDSCLEATCWATLHLMHLILSNMEQALPPDSKELLLYVTSIYTQEDCSLPSPGSIADLRRQPIYTVESLQWQVKQSSVARGLAKKATRHERPLGDIEEEVEMEEEEAETQAACLYSEYLDERRMALRGSVWQVSPDGVKWENYPLGKLPDQSDDPDNLLVENYSVMLTLDQLMDGSRNSTPSATTSEWGGSVAEGLLWTQSDLHKMKNGLQLF